MDDQDSARLPPASADGASHADRRTGLITITLLVIGLITSYWWSTVHSGPTAGPHLIQWQSDPARALALARASDKPLLIDFRADWCGPCRLMEKQFFGDKKIGEFINKHVVCLTVDMTDRSRIHPLAQRFAVSELPTVIIQTPSGREVDRHVGYSEKRRMRRWLRAAVKEAKQIDQPG